MGGRVTGGAARARWGVRLGGGQPETAAPLFKPLPGLVVEFVGHRRMALLMVAVVPFGQLGLQGVDFSPSAFRLPVRASVGLGREVKGEQRKTNEETHREHPCSG